MRPRTKRTWAVIASYLIVLVYLLGVSAPTIMAVGLTDKERDLIRKGADFYWPYAPSCLASNGNVAGIDGSSLPPGANVATVKRFIWDYLTKAGRLTPERAAGVMGNMNAESGFYPMRKQSTPGSVITPTPDNITVGWGLVQWTPGTKIIPAIDSDPFKREAGDVGLQMDILWAQLTNRDSVYMKASGLSELPAGDKLLNSAPDPSIPLDAVDAATEAFEIYFERHAGTRVGTRNGVQQDRKDVAHQILAEFGSGGGGATPTTGTAPASDGGCASTGATTGSGFPLKATKEVIAKDNAAAFRNGRMTYAGHPYAAHDILAPTGTPVLSVLDGEVKHIGTENCRTDLVSIYNAKADVVISYLHITASVSEGQTVTAGQQIGVVTPGDTSLEPGCAIPHLHIDAAAGSVRPGCSRLNCPAANADKFQAGNDAIKLPELLYNGYVNLP